MADDKSLRIVEWPSAALALAHTYAGDRPLPLAASFGTSPVSVRLSTAGGPPLSLSLSSLWAARGTIPLCLSLCESICATSDYTIGITLFDKPVATIRIQGRTVFSRDQ